MNYRDSIQPRNAWTDFFEQTSSVSLEEVLSSGNFELFTSRPRAFPPGDYSQVDGYRELFLKRIRLNPEMANYVDEWVSMLAQCKDVLGVHFRGTDMTVAKSHLAPPTKYQMHVTIDRALEMGQFETIFVATEDQSNLDTLRRRYGQKVVTSDSFRTTERRKLSRMDSPILQWKYLLGKQVIRDTWLLGQCDGLVSGHSNVSEHAQVLAGDRYRVNLQIRRPRVDVLGSKKWIIRLTNTVREMTTSRIVGRDFQIVAR